MKRSGGPPSSPPTLPPPSAVQTSPTRATDVRNVSLPAPLPVGTYAPPPGAGIPPTLSAVMASSASVKPKSTLKALPTVRDHTTDQLNPAGDEYMPREIDDGGEKKVLANGALTGDRKYRCKTFLVANRGDKLFMLATECARVLGYRDSYLLFNKNRSLFKIIASQEEKDDLVAQDILPFSYRSRQIAIVTARSMFRQFGSRMIVDGRRVRDDYWEAKAVKQGFTEADAAGEKRPGGAKAREAAAAAEAAAIAAAAASAGHPAVLSSSTHPDIVYAPGQFVAPPPAAMVQQGMIGGPHAGPPLRMSMMTLASPDLVDPRSRDFGGILKGGPRQEINAPPYTDQTRSTPVSEMQAHAQHAADFNRALNQQRELRSEYSSTAWRRPLEQQRPPTQQQQQPPPPPPPPQQQHAISAVSQAGVAESGLPAVTRTSQSPRTSTTGAAHPGGMAGQSPQMMMSTSAYAQQPAGAHGQPSLRSIPPAGSKYEGPPQSLAAAPARAGGQSASSPDAFAHQRYSYPPSSQMWGPPPSTPQQPYPSYTTQGQAQPHAQQSPPAAGSRPSPQLRHPSSSQMQPGMSFPMPGLPAYGHTQGMYAEQTPRQYQMPQGHQAPPAGTQGWGTQPTQSSQHWWPNQQ